MIPHEMSRFKINILKRDPGINENLNLCKTNRLLESKHPPSQSDLLVVLEMCTFICKGLLFLSVQTLWSKLSLQKLSGFMWRRLRCGEGRIQKSTRPNWQTLWK